MSATVTSRRRQRALYWRFRRVGSLTFLLSFLLSVLAYLTTSVVSFSTTGPRHTTRSRQSSRLSSLTFDTRRTRQWRLFESDHRQSAAVEKETRQQQPQEDVAGPSSASTSSSSFSSEGFLQAADILLNNSNVKEQQQSTRRLFFASSLIAAGTAVAATTARQAEAESSTSASTSSPSYAWGTSKLQWEATPVNKRTGVTVFDAEQSGYNVRFVTYLSRFLLSFDADCQRWWYNRASELPRTGAFEKINELRLQQFAAFSASVEVGLQEYGGIPDGPKTLLRSFLSRYCPSMDDLKASRERAGLPPLSESAEQKQEREIKEARRQIALLFGLMEKNQPVEEITKLLAAIDNGSISSITLQDHGSGYAPGYGPPEVRFPPPEAGDDYETATGRAILKPNGKILRIDVVNRGSGYSKAPTVTISPPAAIRFGSNDTAEEVGSQAQAKAFLFRSGVNKGRIERIQLMDPGAGYNKNEIIRIRISSPELAPQDGGVTATATAVLEYEVSDIQIVKNGTGYAVEKPIPVYVEPPPLTARVNMNDPMMARIVAPDQPLPATTIPSREMLKKMPSPEDPDSVFSRVALEASKAKGDGEGRCIGRACYDRPVVAVAYPRAEKDSYNAFRSEDDALQPQRIEKALGIRSAATAEEQPRQRVVSGSSSGTEGGIPEVLNFAGGRSSSSQLLSLLPAGIGLEFNSETGRYQLEVDPDYQDANQWPLFQQGGTSLRALDPDFGPRGRSPIEREMELGIATYLRFVASGAICCSGVHLALTPIDVVKTKVQTDPYRYPGIIDSFQRISKEQGLAGFFTGWAPTFLGFFLWGGLSYAMTEFLRRALTTLAGANAGSLEVPIILLASGIAAFIGSFVICPFEAVRIRSVAQPDYASNILDVFNRMVKEEGLSSLFSAVPVFLVKEIPFAMAKFTVFDVSTAWMYDAFPAAREDLQLSLLVSLAGGTLGGFVAAVVSNPADATISELKKAKSDTGPVEAAQILVDRGGPAALFTGLPLRMVFYALVVSLQFLVYDSVRFALGIGSDDLKLYLDVLGGALRESGGPV